MIVSVFILAFSTALFLFYLQATCERILAREFANALPDPIVEANSLEFPAVRKALEEANGALNLAQLRSALECDCIALTYLLKNAANKTGRLSPAERLLTLYFRALSSLVNVGKGAVLAKMTDVLAYFTNVLGERVRGSRFGSAACQSMI
jgi:hypothetical protein